jgi:hypothetical protein
MVTGALISAAINDPNVPYFLQAGSGIGLAALVGIAILSNWSTWLQGGGSEPRVE